MKSFWLIALIVLTCLMSTGNAEAAEFEERVQFAAGGELEVSNVAGSVSIRGWDRNEIEVIADIESDADRLEFEVRNGTAFVGVRSERDKGKSKHYYRGQNKEADFEIQVPRRTRVAVSTVSADIDVQGTTSDQRLETVSGDVRTELRGKEAAYRSVSGDLDINGDSTVEQLKINTVSGDVELRGIGGELRLESVSGDLDVVAGQVRRLLGKTVNGDLDFRGQLVKGGEIDFGAINGDIDIVLPSLHDMEFDLESFNGTIDRIFGYKASRKSRYAPGQILRLTEGDGASRIRIETLNGDIGIRATSDNGREPRIKHTSGRYDNEVSDAGGDNDWKHDYDYDDDDDRETPLAEKSFEQAMEELSREHDGGS